MAAGDVVVCPTCGRKNRLPKVAGGSPQCAVCHSPLPWMVEAAEQDFDEVTTTSSLPVLVDVWAPWCAPCRMMTPHIEETARRLAGRLKVVKIDADQAPGISARYGIRGIPTLLILDHGKVVDRRVGAVMGDALRQWIEQAVTRSAA
jgi:thioredoxin 2